MKKKGRPKKKVIRRKVPKFKKGDSVKIDFLGDKFDGVVTEVKQHPQDSYKTIYTVKATDGTIFPYTGVDGTEKYSNIII